MMSELLKLRAIAGWPAQRWRGDSIAHGEHLLARIREGMGIGEALDSVRAVCWLDSLRDPSRGGNDEKLAKGQHANLTRIFRPKKAGARERWIEQWIEAGRPEPRSRGRASTPSTPDELDGVPLTEDERGWWVRELRLVDRGTAERNLRHRRMEAAQ